MPHERWSGRNGRKAAIGAAFFAFAAPALAGPEGLELSFTAPPGCPGEAEVLAAVEQLVGERKVVLRQPLWAEGSVVATAGRFRLELSWRTTSAEAVRTVEGDSCAELSQAAAVIIALAADPAAEKPQGDAVAEQEQPVANIEPAREVAPPRPIPPAARADDGPKSDEQKRSDESIRVSGRAAFALEVGTLPGAAPGGLVGGRLSLPPFAVVLDALTFVPVEREVPAGVGEFWLSAFSLRPCWGFLRNRFRVEPCAALEAHVVRSKGRELDVPDERWAWFARLGLTVEAAYRLSPALSLVAGGALLWAPSRPTFVIEEVPVHEPATFAGRLSLGFELEP